MGLGNAGQENYGVSGQEGSREPCIMNNNCTATLSACCGKYKYERLLDNKEHRLMVSGPDKRDNACALRIFAGTDGTGDRRVSTPSPLFL